MRSRRTRWHTNGRRCRPLVWLAAAAVVALPLALTVMPPAAAQEQQVIVKTGHIASGTPASTYIYVPFDLPRGVSKLSFDGSYTNTATTSLDIALFDNHGHDLQNQAGFRGSSGGDWSPFYVSASSASDSYLPGPIDAGTWYVMVSPYQIGSAGTDWTITITMDFGPPGQPFTPDPYPRTVNNTPGWYRCDDHVHSTQSGGVHSPPAWTMAQEVQTAIDQGLDCFFSTDYYVTTADLQWGNHVHPNFLIVPGEEAVTRTGHIGTAGQRAGYWVDYRLSPQSGRLSDVVDRLHTQGGIAVANHPDTGCKGCSWQFPYTPMDAMEVWNGLWQSDDERALATWDGMLRWGRHITATGGSDAHNGQPIDDHPIGQAQTVVHANGLNVDAITAAVKAGHAFVAGNSQVNLGFTAATTDAQQTAGMGDRLTVGHSAHVIVSLQVRGAAGTVASFHTDDGMVHTVPITSTDQTVTWSTTPGASTYVRAEIRQPNGTMVAFTNPIWLGHAPNDQPAATVGTPDGSALGFALYPNNYGAYSSTFPHDVDFTVGQSNPATDWSYIQPGPADAFAGNRQHPFTLHFHLDRAPLPSQQYAFRAWLVDTPANAGTMQVTANGAAVGTRQLEPGGGDGYHWGDGNLNIAGVYSRMLQFQLPGSALGAGDNAVTVTITSGSWVTWDAAGVYLLGPNEQPNPAYQIVSANPAQLPMLPNEPATATIRVRNYTASPVTAPVHLSVPDGYTAAGPDSITMPAGSDATLPITLTRTTTNLAPAQMTITVGDQSTSVPLQPSDDWARIATMTASSTHAPSSPANLNNGITDSSAWGGGGAGGWNDDTAGVFPDSVTATWTHPVTVSRTVVYTLDSAQFPASRYGVRDYDVQALTADGNWQTVAQVRGNSAGTQTSTFPAVQTTALRILINDSNDHTYSRLIEVEAFTE